MKIVCQRDKLVTAFQTAAMFAPARSPKAILQNVRLDVTSEGCTMMATDMDMGVRVNLEGVEVLSAGVALLPVLNFGAILRESSDATLKIETTTRGTIVRGDRSEFKLQSEDPDEFPLVAAFEETKYHNISAALLKQVITRTEFATDMESSRYALGGVLIELHGDKLVAVGTDGRRLAKMEGPAEPVGGHSTGDNTTIIRTPSMRLFGRAISESDVTVQLAARSSDVLLKTERATFYSRLVEGRFPRWRDVFPRRQEAVKIDLTVGPFFSVLRQAAVVTSQDSRGIDFTFADGTLTLSAATSDAGQSRVEMPISYTGPAITVTLDHRFVADFLKVLSPEQTIVLEIESSESAAVFNADDGAYGYVVMPLSRDR